MPSRRVAKLNSWGETLALSESGWVYAGEGCGPADGPLPAGLLRDTASCSFLEVLLRVKHSYTAGVSGIKPSLVCALSSCPSFLLTCDDTHIRKGSVSQKNWAETWGI